MLLRNKEECYSSNIANYDKNFENDKIKKINRPNKKYRKLEWPVCFNQNYCYYHIDTNSL